jgi:hypothetical protein
LQDLDKRIILPFLWIDGRDFFMTDESDRPKLTVVAENTQTEIDTAWAQQTFDSQLIELAANIIRVVRGAGRPYEIILQCDKVVKAEIAVHNQAGRMPSDYSVATALLLEREEIDDYHSFRGGKKLAMRRMVRGGLQFTASSLLGQPLQIKQGEREMDDAFDELERLYEELRKKREAEARAARARAAPRRKPTQKKARKAKPSVKL